MINNLFAIYGNDVSQLSGPARPQQATAQHVGGGVAVINLAGTLTRDGRYGGTSTDAVRAELSRLAADPSVQKIVVRTNSPGGSSAGSTQLHDSIRDAARIKPVLAYVVDLGASAAYFAICGCTRIIASRSALVGAIGTYVVVEDASALASAIGVKVHVIRAGEFKGMGTPGTALTEQQLQELQRLVNDINAQFLSAVATGRKLTGDKLKIVSDGRLWIASDAKRYSLIDEIGDFQSVLASPITASAGSSQRHSNPALDFQSRLAAQRAQRGEQFTPSAKTGTLRFQDGQIRFN